MSLSFSCRFVVAVLWVLAAVWARADGLYEVSVPVVDQSSKERQRALQEALLTVFGRASGQPEAQIRLHQGLSAELGRAERYLLEYAYQPLNQPLPVTPSDKRLAETAVKTGAQTGAETETPFTALLNARFSPALVQKLFEQLRIPLWPGKRPATLVWWQLEQAGQPRSLSDMQSFQDEARRRGVPVVLPMNDQQDRFAAESLWRMNEEAIMALAGRYGIQQVLVGRAVANPAGWSGQWLLYFRGQFVSFPASEPGQPAGWHNVLSLPELEQQGVQLLVSALLERYALDFSVGQQLVRIHVSGVRQFAAYAEVSRYLQGLEPLRVVRLQQTAGEVLSFEAEYVGSRGVLEEMLVLNGLLQVDELALKMAQEELVHQQQVQEQQVPQQQVPGQQVPGQQVPVTSVTDVAATLQPVDLYYRYARRF